MQRRRCARFPHSSTQAIRHQKPIPECLTSFGPSSNEASSKGASSKGASSKQASSREASSIRRSSWAAHEITIQHATTAVSHIGCSTAAVRNPAAAEAERDVTLKLLQVQMPDERSCHLPCCNRIISRHAAPDFGAILELRLGGGDFVAQLFSACADAGHFLHRTAKCKLIHCMAERGV